MRRRAQIRRVSSMFHLNEFPLGHWHWRREHTVIACTMRVLQRILSPGRAAIQVPTEGRCTTMLKRFDNLMIYCLVWILVRVDSTCVRVDRGRRHAV